MKRLVLGVLIIMGFFKIITAQETINLCTNPSFEAGTADWIATGSSSVAQSSDESWRGAYSLKATFGGGGFIAQYAITLPAASTDYRLTTRVWVPSNWNGGNIFINATSFGAIETIVTQWTADTDDFEKWHYLESSLNPAADVVGDIQIHFDGVPTPTRFIYIDAFQIEEKSIATTYCDGDQKGCGWNGSLHASTSFRSGLSAAGGVEQDMLDDLGFDVQSVLGMGGARLRLNVQPLASLDGNLYQSQKGLAQPFTILGTIQDTTLPLFHGKRGDIKRAFKPGGVLKDQPRVIIYTGADVEKEIDAYYEGGMEGNMDGWPREIGLSMRMIAHDPVWRTRGDGSAILDTGDTLAVESVAARLRSGAWNALGPPSSGGVVRAIAYGNGLVYFGGDFDNFNGIANADRIVSYDPLTDTWAALGTGLSDDVHVLAFGPDGLLYIGGEFANAGGVAAADYLATWDGSSFAAVSGGGTPGVRALAFGLDGTLYIGGTFTNWNALADADYIVSWDGSAYAALGSGLSSFVRALAVDADGLLYLGGFFQDAGGDASADNLAKWDGSAFSAVGPGGGTGVVYTISIAPDGTVFFAGSFTDWNGITAADKVAGWDGNAFFALQDGSTATTIWSSFVGPDNMLYVFGSFDDIGRDIARWNGSSWLPIDAEWPDPTILYTGAVGSIDPVELSKYDIFLGGDFSGNANVSGTTTLTNTGNKAFLPFIQVSRSGGTDATLITIRNATTGTELALDYDLLDGETLTIDLRISRDPFDRKGPNITSNFFGPRNDAILPGSDFTEFKIDPDDNEISTLVLTTGGPTILATMLWRALYDGMDD